MRRQLFIAGAGAMTALALPHLSPRARAAETVRFTLRAAPLNFSPARGLSFACVAFNGTIPGPVLRVVAGQRVRATFVNDGTSGSTVHWHGMILPNAMDGVENVTQPPVGRGGSFTYEFVANPSGTRWYHDHITYGLARGLFVAFVVEDPADERADAEFVLVFHDVPKFSTIDEAMHGISNAPMIDPLDSPEMRSMRPDDRMGDEVAYAAHCINGASYPAIAPLVVKVGQRVRLRVLNANLNQTRYVRLAGHRLMVTHSDGNRLAQPLEVDALRVGVGERYDAWFEVTRPGAWLLEGLSSDRLAFRQAAVVATEGSERMTPLRSPQGLDGVDYFTYEKAGGLSGTSLKAMLATHAYTLDGGGYGSERWTMNAATYPRTAKIYVKRGQSLEVRFKNRTDMDHPMHLHGHTFDVVEVDGKALARPIPKDTSLVGANGGTIAWRLIADSPSGRWLLHCHNAIHMMDGMMTELIYR